MAVQEEASPSNLHLLYSCLSFLTGGSGVAVGKPLGWGWFLDSVWGRTWPSVTGSYWVWEPCRDPEAFAHLTSWDSLPLLAK